MGLPTVETVGYCHSSLRDFGLLTQALKLEAIHIRLAPAGREICHFLFQCLMTITLGTYSGPAGVDGIHKATEGSVRPVPSTIS